MQEQRDLCKHDPAAAAYFAAQRGEVLSGGMIYIPATGASEDTEAAEMGG